MKHSLFPQKKPSRCQQNGSVAIEFAGLFLLFFVVLYAILSYSVPLLLTYTFKQVTADAARATIRVNPALAQEDYLRVISQEVSRVVEASWLPETWRQGNCPSPNAAEPWQTLPPQPGHQSYGHIQPITPINGQNYFLLHICLQRPYLAQGDENTRAIIPILQLPGFTLPLLPLDEVTGTIILRGSTIASLR